MKKVRSVPGVPTASGVCIEEVIGPRIVLVHGAFDQAQTQDADIEIDVFLRITGDRGDVVNSLQLLPLLAHGWLPSFLGRCAALRMIGRCTFPAKRALALHHSGIRTGELAGRAASQRSYAGEIV